MPMMLRGPQDYGAFQRTIRYSLGKYPEVTRGLLDRMGKLLTALSRDGFIVAEGMLWRPIRYRKIGGKEIGLSVQAGPGFVGTKPNQFLDGLVQYQAVQVLLAETPDEGGFYKMLPSEIGLEGYDDAFDKDEKTGLMSPGRALALATEFDLLPGEELPDLDFADLMGPGRHEK